MVLPIQPATQAVQATHDPLGINSEIEKLALKVGPHLTGDVENFLWRGKRVKPCGIWHRMH
jgi:hypothetical protein